MHIVFWVATGQKKRTTVGQELIVLLLGPLPGILAALVVYFYSTRANLPEWVWEFCAITFIINFLNLLPVMPLDGGRIVHALLLRRIPRIGFVFSVLSVAAMAAGAFYLDSWILGILAVFGAIRTPIEWFIGSLTNQVQRTIQQSVPPDLSSQAVTLQVVEAMSAAEVPQALQPLPNRIAVVNRIVKAVQSPTPAIHVAILGSMVYLASLIVPLVVAFLLLIYAPPTTEMSDEELQQWENMAKPIDVEE